MKGKFRLVVWVLIAVLLLLTVVSLQTGYAQLSLGDFFDAKDSVNSQIAHLRTVRTLSMILCGVAVPTSGFLLQEYFQNPLAGPSVLGITSVAGLAVAVYIFAAKDWALSSFLQSSFISLSAFGGSLALMFLLLAYSRIFSDKTYLIIFGFLISALAGAVISILQVYAQSESLKSYVLWSFGSNGQLGDNEVIILLSLVVTGLVLSFKSIKPLIGSSLGSSYAVSLGIDTRRMELLIILASSLLSGAVTAFLGPILFVGIIVPHFCRMLWNASQLWHQWILNLLFGSSLMLLFSIISEKTALPLNIISSLFGVPVILVILVRQNRNRYAQ